MLVAADTAGDCGAIVRTESGLTPRRSSSARKTGLDACGPANTGERTPRARNWKTVRAMNNGSESTSTHVSWPPGSPLWPDWAAPSAESATRRAMSSSCRMGAGGWV